MKQGFTFFITTFFSALNSILLSTALLLAAFLQFISPINYFKKKFNLLVIKCAETWILINNITTNTFLNIKWDIEIPTNISSEKSYFIISNHQSWVDILVLQRIFYKKIPFLRFFLKDVLIFIPLLGLCWWALDFPFMRRYSKEKIKKNPALKGQDLETTKNACKKFQGKPISITNFVEGTRFNVSKHKKQKSELKNLLRPKAGGFGFVMSSMGEQFDKILDTTIYYPDGAPTMIDFLCGNIKKITVRVSEQEVSEECFGNYLTDPNTQKSVRAYINSRWNIKDTLIEKLKKST